MPRVTMEPIKLCQVIWLWQGQGQEDYSWMAGWNVVLEALKNFPGVCAVWTFKTLAPSCGNLDCI